jgi:hypothetical protein
MEDATPHEPSYADACSVLEILKFFKLPTELALEVLEHAAYWPSWQSSMRQSCHASTNAGLRRNQGGAHDAVICFDSPMPDSQLLPYIEQKSIKIKEVQFDFVSRDQGWTSENTTGKTENFHISHLLYEQTPPCPNHTSLRADFQIYRNISNILLA